MGPTFPCVSSDHPTRKSLLRPLRFGPVPEDCTSERVHAMLAEQQLVPHEVILEPGRGHVQVGRARRVGRRWVMVLEVARKVLEAWCM